MRALFRRSASVLPVLCRSPSRFCHHSAAFRHVTKTTSPRASADAGALRRPERAAIPPALRPPFPAPSLPVRATPARFYCVRVRACGGATIIKRFFARLFLSVTFFFSFSAAPPPPPNTSRATHKKKRAKNRCKVPIAARACAAPPTRHHAARQPCPQDALGRQARRRHRRRRRARARYDNGRNAGQRMGMPGAVCAG